MKSTLVILWAAVLLTFSATSLWAEDWKTTDGKVYQNVRVLAVKPDAVTILHNDGGALVPLAKLPPDIQKRFGYDPAKAKAAADARIQENAANARVLQAEMNLAAKMRQAGTEAQDTDAPEANSSPADDARATSATPVPSKSGHNSMADLSIHSLGVDPADSSHHSISDLSGSIYSLRRDLSDPTYHTMAHLSFTIHSLGSDPSDPNHHSISDAADSGH